MTKMLLSSAYANSRSRSGSWSWLAIFPASSLLLLLLLYSQPTRLFSQPSPSPNRVLELDGRKGYVELPANLFANLTQATVECWVRFEEFVNDSRVFDFGAGNQQIYLSHDQLTPRLKYLLVDPGGGRHRIEIAELWRLDRRC